MATKFNDCLCELANLLGSGKDQASSLITYLIELLQGLKATILLFAIDIEDELRRVKYEAELAVIQQTLDSVTVPFSWLLSRTKYLADCDPVASFSQNLKEVYNDLFLDLEERTYELEMLISAIADKQKKLEVIDKRIDFLTQIRDALDACG